MCSLYRYVVIYYYIHSCVRGQNVSIIIIKIITEHFCSFNFFLISCIFLGWILRAELEAHILWASLKAFDFIGCTNLYSHQQYMKVYIIYHPSLIFFHFPPWLWKKLLFWGYLETSKFLVSKGKWSRMSLVWPSAFMARCIFLASLMYICWLFEGETVSVPA